MSVDTPRTVNCFFTPHIPSLRVDSTLTELLRGQARFGTRTSGDKVGGGVRRAGSSLSFLLSLALPARTGQMTKLPLQSGAWTVSHWWDEVRSTHPSPGDRARGSGWEMWAQSPDFHPREESDHKLVPGSGAWGGRREQSPLKASEALALVGGMALLLLTHRMEEPGCWSPSDLAPPLTKCVASKPQFLYL